MICKELTDACMEGDVVCVRALIAREADVNYVDADETHEGRYTWTPLMHAASRGYDEIVRTLLDAGAETDLRDRDSNTALTLAASAGHWETVSLLLDRGADAAVRDHCGETAFDYALRAGQNDMAARLRDAAGGKAALA
jgi:ankyrin repeat protein